MAEPTEPLTPEEEAALRVLEITHRRRHWWIALALFVVHALLGGMITSAWHLRCVREHEAAERQWTRQDARWRAQDRVWRPQREESRRRLREGEAR
jgi:hypothetical protein